jgi:hypothetical protein
MARELDENDIRILKKMVPELNDMLSTGIEIDYMNVLPPVANHHSKDEKDFEERLKRLSTEEIKYLADKVLKGSEGLSCLYPEYAEAFFAVAGRKLSSELADKLREAYETGSECEV